MKLFYFVSAKWLNDIIKLTVSPRCKGKCSRGRKITISMTILYWKKKSKFFKDNLFRSEKRYTLCRCLYTSLNNLSATSIRWTQSDPATKEATFNIFYDEKRTKLDKEIWKLFKRSTGKCYFIRRDTLCGADQISLLQSKTKTERLSADRIDQNIKHTVNKCFGFAFWFMGRDRLYQWTE